MTSNDGTPLRPVGGAGATIVVCLKWVPIRSDVDPLTGTVATDERFTGVSPADQAALEHGLVLAAAWSVPLAVVTVGPQAADQILTDALAVGADVALRLPAEAAPSSERVGHAIAAAFPDAALFLCGDYSLDRGSGSVPAYVAHARRAEQALGLTRVEPATTAGVAIMAERRLDQGRRERLELTLPAVISVEGGRELRRASLPALLAATSSEVELGPSVDHAEDKVSPMTVVRSGPYRPRARVVPAPEGETIDRVRSLTGADVSHDPPLSLELTPEEAAALVVERLRSWGYLDHVASNAATDGDR